jgi:hypothetical protein
VPFQTEVRIAMSEPLNNQPKNIVPSSGPPVIPNNGNGGGGGTGGGGSTGSGGGLVAPSAGTPVPNR